MGFDCFFLQGLQGLAGNFPNLFGNQGEESTIESTDRTNEDGGGEEESETPDIIGQWFAIIDDLAKGNRSKWEYYLNMNVVEFLNELAFRKDKKKKQSNEVVSLIKGKTTEQSTVLLLAYLAQKM